MINTKSMRIILVSLFLGSVYHDAAPSNKCHHGWNYFQASCYFFGQQFMDWVYAEAFCKAHHAELVAIETQEENEFVTETALNLTGRYWLGGSDAIAENVWEWAATDEPFGFTNWGIHEPNNKNGGEDCLMISDTYHPGKWNDLNCTIRLNFICERRYKHIHCA